MTLTPSLSRRFWAVAVRRRLLRYSSSSSSQFVSSSTVCRSSSSSTSLKKNSDLNLENNNVLLNTFNLNNSDSSSNLLTESEENDEKKIPLSSGEALIAGCALQILEEVEGASAQATSLLKNTPSLQQPKSSSDSLTKKNWTHLPLLGEVAVFSSKEKAVNLNTSLNDNVLRLESDLLYRLVQERLRGGARFSEESMSSLANVFSKKKLNFSELYAEIDILDRLLMGKFSCLLEDIPNRDLHQLVEGLSTPQAAPPDDKSISEESINSSFLTLSQRLHPYSIVTIDSPEDFFVLLTKLKMKKIESSSSSTNINKSEESDEESGLLKFNFILSNDGAGDFTCSAFENVPTNSLLVRAVWEENTQTKCQLDLLKGQMVKTVTEVTFTAVQPADSLNTKIQTEKTNSTTTSDMVTLNKVNDIRTLFQGAPKTKLNEAEFAERNLRTTT